MAMMSAALSVAAPAKGNLVLRVLDRRPDGFHELETVFERIDLADELTFEPRERGIVLACDDPSLDCGPSNLVMKAARALLETSGVSRGAAISLAKRTPVASGLGGGSSDAASTLIGLNRLWDLKLPQTRLAEIGATLGSDVPFFIYKAAFAVGRGRGERCEPVAGRIPPLHQVIVVPPERLSTKDVYAGFARQRAEAVAAGQETALTASEPSISMFLHALRNGSLSELALGITNDLQPEAIRRCPVIQVILTQLRESGSIGSCVSGSGSAVFGLYPSAQEAQRAVERLRQSGRPEWFVRRVSTWDGSLIANHAP